VTRNLHAALNRLRLPDKPRTLWVDAICIDQADVVEKGHQVALMGEIYSKTTRGIIFLGEEPEELGFNETLEERRQLQSFFTGIPTPGLEAFHAQFQMLKASAGPDMLAVLNQVIGGISQQPAPRDNIIQRTQECVWNADDRDIPILIQADDHNFENDTIFHAFCLLRLLAMDTHPSEIGYITSEFEDGIRYPSKAIRALKWLGERPWWKRIWTVQECILPTQCVVVYGPVQAPWSMFYDAMSNLQRHRISCCASVPGISETLSGLSVIMTHLRDIQTWRQEGRGISLSTLMKAFRYRQATRKRDKVYGLLGLVTDWGTAGPGPIIPDYNMSTTHQQIFTRSTAAIIKSTGSLDILCQQGNIDINYFGTLPSWVIDYSMPVSELGTTDRYHHQIPLYNASGGASANIRTIEENILVLEAIMVDSLSTVCEAMDAGYREPQLQILNQWLDKTSQEKSNSTNWKQNFWRVLCGDTVVDPTSTYRRANPANELLFDIQGLLSGRLPVGPAVKAATTRRKFFISTMGFMGLASDRAGGAGSVLFGKEEVFVIPGGKTPFLLRPSGTRHVPGIGIKPCYHFLGDCYLHGFMDGEGMRDFDRKKQTIYLV